MDTKRSTNENLIGKTAMRSDAQGYSNDRFPACPVCGAELIEIRQKFQCSRCHTICETCCEGGRG